MLLFLYATWLVPFAHVILGQALQNLAGANGRLALECTDVLFISEASCDRVTVRHKRVKTVPYFHDELCVER